MPRLAIIITLILSVFSAGCTSQKIVLPSNQDPAQLLGEIEAQGKDNQPFYPQDYVPMTVQATEEEPDPVGDAVVACAVTGVKLTATCVVLSFALLYVAAAKGSGGYPGAGDGVSKALHDIWAD